MSDKSPESSEAEPDPGFSAAERAVGAWAAYKPPIIWSVVANEMLESETSPAAETATDHAAQSRHGVVDRRAVLQP